MPNRALLAAVVAALLTACASPAPVPADGALPLDVLEAKVDRWITQQKEG